MENNCIEWNGVIKEKNVEPIFIEDGKYMI